MCVTFVMAPSPSWTEGHAGLYLCYLVSFQGRGFIEIKGYLQLISDCGGFREMICFVLSGLYDIEENNGPVPYIESQIARFMWPTWGPSGSCRSQMGPMMAP